MSDNFVPMDAPKKASGVSIASLICGIAGFCCSPLYLVNWAAIVMAIIGLAGAKGRPKGMAIAGLVLGIVGFLLQSFGDTIISVFTMGFGFISVFF